MARTAIGAGGQSDQEAFIVAMLRVVTILRASREVEGFARGGAIEVLRAHRTLASLNAPLAAGYVVLDLHQRPRAIVPIIQASAGALAFLALILLLVGGRRPEKAVERPLLPAMMVLNLDAIDYRLSTIDYRLSTDPVSRAYPFEPGIAVQRLEVDVSSRA